MFAVTCIASGRSDPCMKLTVHVSCADPPEIMVSEQRKFVVRKVSKLSVDVGSTVYAVKGTEITVSCKVSANDPIKVEWLRFGLPVIPRFQGGVAAVNGVLTIRRLSRFNEGSYTCRASNENGEAEEIFSAKILGKLSNP